MACSKRRRKLRRCQKQKSRFSRPSDLMYLRSLAFLLQLMPCRYCRNFFSPTVRIPYSLRRGTPHSQATLHKPGFLVLERPLPDSPSLQKQGELFLRHHPHYVVKHDTLLISAVTMPGRITWLPINLSGLDQDNASQIASFARVEAAELACNGATIMAAQQRRTAIYSGKLLTNLPDRCASLASAFDSKATRTDV